MGTVAEPKAIVSVVVLFLLEQLLNMMCKLKNVTQQGGNKRKIRDVGCEYKSAVVKPVSNNGRVAEEF